MSETQDPSKDLAKEYAIVEKEYSKNPQNIQNFVKYQMDLYGGPEKALEKLKKLDVSNTPAFFRRIFGKLLASAMQEIEKMGINSEAIKVLNNLVEKLKNTAKRIKQGGKRRSKTFRKKQQLVGGGKALTTLIIFLVTICYMASALGKTGNNIVPEQNDILTTFKTKPEVSITNGYGQFDRQNAIYTMKFKNGKPESVAKIDYKNGDSYSGDIEDYEPTGYGVFIKNGVTFRGKIDKDGNGSGTIETPEYLYKGQFKNFLPNGFGQKIIKGDSQKEITGEFKNGDPIGFGMVIEGNKETKGRFENNIISSYSFDLLGKKLGEEKLAKKQIESANEALSEADVDASAAQYQSYKVNDLLEDYEKQEIAKLDFKSKITNAAILAIPILILIFAAGKTMSDQKQISLNPPPPPSNSDYLAIILAACKTLFFEPNKILIKTNGWTVESYKPYSYEKFLNDVNTETGDRIRAALRLLSDCKTDNNELLLIKYSFLNRLEENHDDEEIVYAFLDELSPQTKGGTQTKGGAHQIIKKSPFQKRNAQTTKKNKLRTSASNRAHSRSRAFART
jgi:hypothetical protein